MVFKFEQFPSFLLWPAEQVGENFKMKEYEEDNLGFGIFEKVDKDLGLSRGTAWDASGWKDYCDFGFGDV